MNKEADKNSKSLNNFVDSLKVAAYPIFAIIVAIIVSVFFVVWAKGYYITEYFSALGDLFSTIWKGSFGDTRRTLETMVYVTPLIFTGVANAIAFRCGLFNIGVEGQFVMGMTSAAIIGLIPGLSSWVHIPLIIIGGIVAGAIWGGIPGYLKAKVGTNEVINTIMMNYLGLYLANYIILRTRFTVKGSSSTAIIEKSAQLLRFSNMSRANVALIIGIIFAILIYWLLWKTTIGYEIRAVGINPFGAEYGGVSVSKNIVLAMVLSGAIAGIGGATHISGVMLQAQDMMSLPGFGFDGIAVALLAKNNPIACILSALLFGTLNSSSKILQINGIPKEIVYLIQSIIIIFVATDYIVKYFSERKKRKVLING
ncbi:ABC transporter permease [Clostridium sp. DJ247]|uniref:ABC transporter permease n=1 Tax=Clostridium sp. DJ247 TaxID=2726188 RepID=UPI001629DC8C|nr:ABC transporter permease [Clostridium sp. DJ247]MBC2582067.1 ABC transporter permease [Clostridium sp. DJ247]